MSKNNDEDGDESLQELQDFPSRGDSHDEAKSSTTSTAPSPNSTTQRLSIFAVPVPLKRIFDRFPWVTHPSNEPPARAPRGRDGHVLHIFTTSSDARVGRPSFNPACLKWQTYLRFCGLPFRVAPSSNHASPSGMLPYLQPAGSNSQSLTTVAPVPSHKLERWLQSQKDVQKRLEDPADVRYTAYASLLDNRIRKAWLCQLYLTPQNVALVSRLYVEPCSSQPLVQIAIARQLRFAAEAELIKSTGLNVVSAIDLWRDAAEALEALSVLLGSNDWFFGHSQAGLFDASVFAYTHLILSKDLEWKYNPLAEALWRYHNLVQHQQRIADMYF